MLKSYLHRTYVSPSDQSEDFVAMFLNLPRISERFTQLGNRSSARRD